MLRKALVIEGGDTKFIQGDQVSYAELKEENSKAEADGKNPAEYERVLLGITKASLATDSFISPEGATKKAQNKEMLIPNIEL